MMLHLHYLVWVDRSRVVQCSHWLLIVYVLFEMSVFLVEEEWAVNGVCLLLVFLLLKRVVITKDVVVFDHVNVVITIIMQFFRTIT
jgi:hypothetical protein